MKYNKSKKIKVKIVQIDKSEFKKAESGKEFKLKFITQAKPVPPIDPTDGGNRGNDVVQPPKPTLATVIKMIVAMQVTLAEHGEAIAGVKTELTNVIKLNNLKH